MAVRREPAGLMFPPLRKTADIMKSLPKGHALLIFVATTDTTYGFLLGSDKYGQWQVNMPLDRLSKRVTGLLCDLGNMGAGHEITMKDLADAKLNDKWKQAGKVLLNDLLKDSPADFSKKFEELIIVPDGVLWYLPFEALQVNIGGRTQSLLSHVRIRYVADRVAGDLGRRGRPAAARWTPRRSSWDGSVPARTPPSATPPSAGWPKCCRERWCCDRPCRRRRRSTPPSCTGSSFWTTSTSAARPGPTPGLPCPSTAARPAAA